MLYAIQPHYEEYDNLLKTYKAGNDKFGRYTSFKDTSPNNKLGSLYLIEMMNINARFEVLENVVLDDLVMKNEEVGTIKDRLLEIEVNETLLFIRVE